MLPILRQPKPATSIRQNCRVSGNRYGPRIAAGNRERTRVYRWATANRFRSYTAEAEISSGSRTTAPDLQFLHAKAEGEIAHEIWWLVRPTQTILQSKH